MATNNLLSQARTQLVLHCPFFASILLRLKFTENSTRAQGTMGTDGFNIVYCSEFLKTLNVSTCKGVLCHEVMHIVLCHHTRRGARNPRIWNLAADLAINPLITQFELPGTAQTLKEMLYGGEGYLLDPLYFELSTEEIYARIESLIPPGMEICVAGSVMDAQGDLQEAEQETRVMIAQAILAERNAGKSSLNMDRILGSTPEVKIDWRERLQRFFNRTTVADANWRKVNRRHVYNGLYLPTAEIIPTGTVVICVDTSGSIQGPELDAFASEMKAIFDFAKPTKTIVIYCDASIAHIDEFEQGDDFTINARGGGGTDFRPPFEWIEKNDTQPDAVVYLTDGYGPFPEEQEYPTLWVINNTHITPPWGEHLTIEAR